MGKAQSDRGQGTVRWHRGGWEMAVYVDGKRRTKRVGPGPNTKAGRRDAEDALDRWRTHLALGVDRMVLSQLIDAYVAHAGPGWSPTTLRQVPATRAALLRHLGDVPVDTIRLRHLEAAYAAMLAEPTRRGGKPTSVGTVKRRAGFMRAALAHAVRWEAIAVNPAREAKVEGDAAVRAGQDLPAMVDVWGAIARIDHPRLRITATLAAATGARRGELAYLRWSDVDVDTGVVRFLGSVAVVKGGLVRKGTKTGKTKVVTLDPITLADLKAWRASCVAAALAMGTAIDPRCPVVPSPADPREPWHPEQMTRRWATWRVTVGLGEEVRLHDLRHLQATELLGEGISPAAGAARLGHSSTRTFLDRYAHARKGDDQAAADVVERSRRKAT